MTDERFLDLAVRLLLDGLGEVDAAEFDAALADAGAEGEAVVRRLRETFGTLAVALSTGRIPLPAFDHAPVSDAAFDSRSSADASSAHPAEETDRVLPHAMEPPDRLRTAILDAIESTPQLPPQRAAVQHTAANADQHADATVTVVAETAENVPGRLASVAGEERADGSDQPLRGWKRVKGNKGLWMPLALGVSMKVLHIDKPAKMATMLVRMKPGSQFPSHQHAGYEECFIVDGTLDMNGWKLQAGDYVHGDEGSTHVDMVTEDGATVLVITSVLNEWL